MNCHTSVGWSLCLLWLVAFVCNAQDVWAGSFQISEVASDILDQETDRGQVGFGPSVLDEPHNQPVTSAPVERVPHGEMRDRFPPRQMGGDSNPINWVPNQLVERGSDDWRQNWALHGQLAKPAFHSRTGDSMVPPVVLVPQAQQQAVAQSPSVGQIPQVQIVAQATGMVPQVDAQSTPIVQVPHVQSVAQVSSDTLSPGPQDEGGWQVRHGLSGLEEHRNRLEDEIPVVRVPYGEAVERLPHRQLGGDRHPLNRVPHQSEERVSDDWRVNWVPQGQLAALDFPSVSVSQAQQETVAQSPPVVPVAQDQAVVAQSVPVVHVASDALATVDQDQWTWQLGRGHSGLEAPRQLADLAPVARVPYDEMVQRIPHHRRGGEEYALNRVPHPQSERVSDDWQVNWVPRGHTWTADSMVLPVVGVSRAQQQTVAQSPPVASVAQAQPVLQGPLESPMVMYTRPLVQSVAADCRENSVLVAVKRDLLGIGQLIQPSDVTLGGCAPTGQDNAAGVLLFQAPLQGCGSTLTVRADVLVYTFTLIYMPHALGHAPVVRTNGAAVSVECRYLRLHNVSSSAIRPTWVPFLATRRSEDRLVFSLKLMSDDWQSQRASNTYFLGDLINIEASVSVAHHVPLRVFVDGCVATLVPNLKAVPRYDFIENHGCLVDAKLTRSRSQFLRRRQPDKLQFQLDAFRFSGDPRSSIYLTCLLKATPASAETTFEYKACSFTANRWVAAGGHDRVCDCCDASCSERREWNRAGEFKGEVLLGPVNVHEFVKGDRN